MGFRLCLCNFRRCLIKLWHLYSQELINTLSGHLSTVHSVAFNVDGNKIISGSADHTIRIWQSEQ
ncbi:WD40 repeat domain-containing protein [Sphaerospermopsis reniformis]|uniref:WD40 repeat domain-containing protein n=1 Tax=Sphaerospermopsis reniformis TaxID=531300 RepID=UPI0010F77BFE|nr:hypothetical protein [Sphaerospermopsis reniformis]